MTRHLLIVADDFGYGKSRNYGIVECFQQDAISAVSILPNCKHSNHAVKLAKKYNIPVGLHFNITEGKPLSNPENVCSLLSPDGKFLGKTEFWACSSLIAAHIEYELKAQLRWFENVFNKMPLHVDGHQHAHIHPGVVQIYAKVLSQYKIKRTRLPIEHLHSMPSSKMPLKRISFHKHIMKLSKQSSKIFQMHGIKTTEAFIGLNLMGDAMTSFKLMDTLKNIFNSNVSICELMVHPGYKCNKDTDGFIGDDFADEFSCSSDREHELHVLTSNYIMKFYKEENVTLKHCEVLRTFLLDFE